MLSIIILTRTSVEWHNSFFYSNTNIIIHDKVINERSKLTEPASDQASKICGESITLKSTWTCEIESFIRIVINQFNIPIFFD